MIPVANASMGNDYRYICSDWFCYSPSF